MKDADAWHQQGMHHIGMSFTADYQSEMRGDLENALAAFDQALALRADHPGALREKAIALARLDRHEQAGAAFAQAIRVRPEEAELHLQHAESLSKLGRHDEALGACDEALARRPQDAAALYLRGRTLDALGRSAEALAAWEEVLHEAAGRGVRNGDFRHAQAKIARAICLERVGRREDAVAAFRKLLEQDSTRLAESDFHAALRSAGTAREAYSEFLAAGPADPAAWLRAGRAFLQAARPEEALHAYQTAARLAPANADTWWGVAEALAQAGRREDSIAMFDEALRIRPDYLGPKARRQAVLRQLALARDPDDSKRPGARG